MRGQHAALSDMALKNNIRVSNLSSGEYVVFVNRKKDRIKVFAANNIIAYHKSVEGRIDMGTIALIPKAFEGSGNLNYNKALKKRLELKLGK